MRGEYTLTFCDVDDIESVVVVVVVVVEKKGFLRCRKCVKRACLEKTRYVVMQILGTCLHLNSPTVIIHLELKC
jgi:hypothetical protein